MGLYINDFFLLLEKYYNINKLTINPEKSKFIIICKNKDREITKNVKLKTSQNIIDQSKKIKILGIYVTNGLNQEANINNIVSKISYRMSILKEIFKFTNHKTKLMLTNSIIISVFRYAAPILIDATQL